MPTVYNKFNRGEIDEFALAREDVTKVTNSGSYMLNWLPRRLGPMQRRPGTEYLLEIDNGAAVLVPFVRDLDDQAIIEMTANQARIIVNDEVVTRSSVNTDIFNSGFNINLSSWTDNSGVGSTAAWGTGGYAVLTGTNATAGSIYQTSSNTVFNVEHALRIVVERAPVEITIGTDGADSADIYSGTLDPGVHSLVFTPTDDFTITLSNNKPYQAKIDSCGFETTGDLTLPHGVGASYLKSIRYKQSADVIFCASRAGQPFKIERRGVKSWSIVDYRVDDGPFGIINTTDITMTASALNGDTILTASKDYFTADHVGALFKLGSEGQQVTSTVGSENDGTNSIKVTGKKKGDGRVFNIAVVPDGSWNGIVTLQQSLDDTVWTDLKTWDSISEAVEWNDKLDNQEIYYRLWVKTGDYTAGSVDLTLTYPNGSIEGVCRVVGYSNPTSVDIQVLTDFGSTDATRDWYEGVWSDAKGWPSALTMYEGRVWLVGPDIWGSVTDDFESFDRDDTVGESASIVRQVGFGPVPDPYWIIESTQLTMGIITDEISIRSTSEGNRLTPDNTNVRSGSNQGAANVNPVRIDNSIYFTQRAGNKIMELMHDPFSEQTKLGDLMVMNERVCQPGIARLAFTRQPETRLWVVLDDGTARVFTFDKSEDVAGWARLDTNSGADSIEDVIVMPSLVEDSVYLVINRSNGRYLEKMAFSTEAEGATVSKHYDSFVKFTSPGTTASGMGHLEGETVHIWGDGSFIGSAVVSSGYVYIGAEYTDVVIGLPYNADWKSNKLNAHRKYSTLATRQRVHHLGIIGRTIVMSGISYGPAFDDLKSTPDYEDGDTFDKTSTSDEYDTVPFEFDGMYETDSRICIRATLPATILALTYEIEESDPKPVKND